MCLNLFKMQREKSLKSGFDQLVGDKSDYDTLESGRLPPIATGDMRQPPEPTVVKELDPSIISDKERPDLISPEN